MEKRTPHYSLTEIQDVVVKRGALAFTRTAISNGHAMGLTVQEMMEVVWAAWRTSRYPTRAGRGR
jgi:motility quorum-sensing regulator / GCU-specific mRNA interferase toxin